MAQGELVFALCVGMSTWVQIPSTFARVSIAKHACQPSAMEGKGALKTRRLLRFTSWPATGSVRDCISRG